MNRKCMWGGLRHWPIGVVLRTRSLELFTKPLHLAMTHVHNGSGQAAARVLLLLFLLLLLLLTVVKYVLNLK